MPRTRGSWSQLRARATAAPISFAPSLCRTGNPDLLGFSCQFPGPHPIPLGFLCVLASSSPQAWSGFDLGADSRGARVTLSQGLPVSRPCLPRPPILPEHLAMDSSHRNLLPGSASGGPARGALYQEPSLSGCHRYALSERVSLGGGGEECVLGGGEMTILKLQTRKLCPAQDRGGKARIRIQTQGTTL